MFYAYIYIYILEFVSEVFDSVFLSSLSHICTVLCMGPFQRTGVYAPDEINAPVKICRINGFIFWPLSSSPEGG